MGAVFASGKIDALAEVVLQFDWKKIVNFFDVVLPKSGLIDGKKVSDFVRSFVDGGLVNPVPVSAARSMGADFVIAVDLNHDIVEKKGHRRLKRKITYWIF